MDIAGGFGRPRQILSFPLPRLSLLQRFALAGFGVFGVLGFALAILLGRSVQQSALANARQAASDDVHARLLRHLRPADLRTPMRGARYQRFRAFIEDSILSDRTVRVKVWDPHGTVIFSSDPQIVGKTFAVEDELDRALHGDLASDISTLQSAENQDDRSFKRLLEVYIPIQFQHTHGISGAFEIYQRYDPVAHQIASLQRAVYEFLAGGLIVLYVLLFGIVRNGSRTIQVQQRRIVGHVTQLEESYHHTIAALASAVDARDSTTQRHSQRVTELSVALGHWMGLPPGDLRDLERGALLHDVGKIGVRDAVLLKPGKLTADEWEEMRRHPEIGHHMLKDVPFLHEALPVVLHHHEHWDGHGYPVGLTGEAIPLAARLFAVIDAYDALTSDRPYRPALSHEAALEIIRHDTGTHFDPNVVTAFEQMMQTEAQGSAAEEDTALDQFGTHCRVVQQESDVA